MRRILKMSVRQTLLVSFSTLLAATSSQAGTTPIRYGHETNASSAELPVQMASLDSKSMKTTTGKDGFWYPDEPIILDRSSVQPPARKISAQVDTATSAVVRDSNTLQSIDAAEYRSYAKFGTPYTIDGITYYPDADPFYDTTGTASWYGPGFHGGVTANGEVYDMTAMTAAHKTLPLPSYVRVTNLENGREIVVRLNDRGPFAKGREIDLSFAAAEKLDMIDQGSAQVRVQYLGPAEKAADAPFQKSTPQKIVQQDYPKSTPAMVPSDYHFVQLGSFASKQNASNFLSQVAPYSKDADVVFANVNGAPRYRVVLGPFLSKSDATAKQVAMSHNGFNGLVIRNP